MNARIDRLTRRAELEEALYGEITLSTYARLAEAGCIYQENTDVNEEQE